MSRILVVEDEPTIAIALQDDLELEGYDVEAVSDGLSAEARALQGNYDLILLDVMLPGKDGFSVCRALRKAGMKTPVIMLTAKTQVADRIAGLDIGADDYITKPFAPEELIARIRAVLRRAGTQNAGLQTVCSFGDVTVDFERYEAKRSGRAVDLTALEFKLLRVFLEHRGKVLSIDDLLRLVWGPDVFLTDRVIYTHINNLRSKLEDEPARPRYLVGVRGLGFGLTVSRLWRERRHAP